MLKENEKRTFWIVVMAVAAVSLISAWLSSFVVGLECIVANAEYLGRYESADFSFSLGFMLLVMFLLVAVAIALLSTVGRKSLPAKIVGACVIGGFFLLTSLIFTIVYHVTGGSASGYTYHITYISNTLAIAISYELAFLAQCMLARRPKQEAPQETPEQPKENTTDDEMPEPQAGIAEAGESTKPQTKAQENTLKTIAKIFMLISCIATGVALIPLIWTVPMTKKYWDDVKLGRPTSTAFKVCTLIFVDTISGILMLCDNE